MEHVRRPRPTPRERQRQAGKTRVVTVSTGLPSCIVSRQGSELDPEDRRLDGVETRIDADPGADIPLAPAIFPNFAQRSRESGIIGDDHAAVAEGAEILGRVEAEACDIPERADRSTAVECAMA